MSSKKKSTVRFQNIQSRSALARLVGFKYIQTNSVSCQIPSNLIFGKVDSLTRHILFLNCLLDV